MGMIFFKEVILPKVSKIETVKFKPKLTTKTSPSFASPRHMLSVIKSATFI